MKLAFIGLKGHVGTVLAGAKQLGDVEVVAVSNDDPQRLADFLKSDPLLKHAQGYEQWRHLLEHSLDIFRWVTGLDFTTVAAMHGNLGSPKLGETESYASILAQLANGASVTARLDYLRPTAAPTHGDDRLRIIGTKGLIEVNEGNEAVSLITDEKTERIPFGETENLFVEFAKFLSGGPRPRISADDCFDITEVTLHSRESADKKSRIELPPRRPVRG